MTKACMALLERNFRGYLSVLTAICFAEYLNYIYSHNYTKYYYAEKFIYTIFIIDYK